jgi:hypothetical protein
MVLTIALGAGFQSYMVATCFGWFGNAGLMLWGCRLGWGGRLFIECDHAGYVVAGWMLAGWMLVFSDWS